MTQPIFYPILFFDGDSEHRHINNDIIFCNSERYLTEILELYGQVKLTVCICCKNKRRVLNKLQQCLNVASIFVCTRHHFDHNESNCSTNHPLVIKEKLLEEDILTSQTASKE